MKKSLTILIAVLMFITSLPSSAFTRITYIVDKQGDFVSTEKSNNQVRKELRKKKLRLLHARRPRSKKGVDVFVNATVPTDADSIQDTLTVNAFLSAVQDAVNLWNGITISSLMINDPLLSTLNVDSTDGNFVITGNPDSAIEGVPDLTTWYTIVNIATKKKVEIAGRNRKVRPGTVIDVDLAFNPSLSDCASLVTTGGTIQTGGDPAATTVSGGIITATALMSCSSDGLVIDQASLGDITDGAVKGIARMLGLEASALNTAATGRVAQNMVRYALTQDEEIALANIYPAKKNFGERGSVYGRVKKGKVPVVGAHVVLEESSTGEVVASTISDIRGRFSIMAVPAGTYFVIAEPLDGAVRPNAFLSYFKDRAETEFTTVVSDRIAINKRSRKRVTLKVPSTSAAAFNINPKIAGFKTDKEITDNGGSALFLVCSPGQTLDDIEFWGSNIDSSIGTLSVSGDDVTVSDIMTATISISDLTGAEQFPGLTADISCLAGAMSGMRNIIFTADKLSPTDPNFKLQDQISGGLIVRE